MNISVLMFVGLGVFFCLFLFFYVIEHPSSLVVRKATQRKKIRLSAFYLEKRVSKEQ